MRISANENLPSAAVTALREAGHDVFWIRTEMGGATDEQVLAHAVANDRIVVTFDKDFGELAYRVGLPITCGSILFRIPMDSPDVVAARVVNVIASRSDWVGLFAVADQWRIRIRAIRNTPQ